MSAAPPEVPGQMPEAESSADEGGGLVELSPMPRPRVQSPSFSELARQLEAEHEREVASLRAEIAQLSALHGAARPGRRRSRMQTCPSEYRESAPALLPAEGLDGKPASLAGTLLPSQVTETPCSLRLAASQKMSPRPSTNASIEICRNSSDAPTVVETPTNTMAPEMLETPLVVTVVGAMNLRRADWGPGRSADPYCIVEIEGKPAHRVTTPVIEKTRHPTWNHTATMLDYTHGDVVTFTVWDQDWGTEDELLGTCSLTAKDLAQDGGFNGRIQLREAGEGIQAYLNVKLRPIDVAAVQAEAEHQDAAFFLYPMWLSVPSESKFKEVPFFQRTWLKKSQSAAWPNKNFLHHKRDYCIIHPESQLRLIWDCLGILILMIDLIWIPMAAFEPPDRFYSRAVEWSTMSYWTFDIFMTFNTGYHLKDGTVMMKRSYLALNYLKGWLVLDFCLASLDWAMVIQKAMHQGNGVGESAGFARSARVARITRIVRLLRLMRLAKLRQLLFTLQSIIDSEWVTIIFAVGKNLMTLLGINHMLACMWFAVGHESRGWVQVEGVMDEDFGVQYLMALHWSLCQFTPGSSSVEARTTAERVFGVLTLTLGLIMATCFVSSITSTMASVWTMGRYNNTQSILLKKFLHQHGVSRALGSRITRYVDFVLELRQRRVDVGKVHFLTLLSGPLHIELQNELFEPKLSKCPCFREISKLSQTCMREICATAIVSNNYARNDAIFLRDSVAKEMSCLTFGTLAYHFRDSAREDEMKTVTLAPGHYFCEAALWMPWKHHGEMKSVTEVDTISVNAAKFREIVAASRLVYACVRAYALYFWQEMEAGDSNVNDLPQELRSQPTAVEAALRRPSQQGIMGEIEEAEIMQAAMVSFSEAQPAEFPSEGGALQACSSVNTIGPPEAKAAPAGRGIRVSAAVPEDPDRPLLA